MSIFRHVLRVVACTLNERPDIAVDSYIERLAVNRGHLEGVEASIKLSYDLLEDNLKKRLQALSLFINDFQLRAATKLWGTNEHSASNDVGTLLRQSLIEWDENSECYWMHDLVQTFAFGLLNQQSLSEIESVKWRFCETFLAIVEEAQKLYLAGPDEAENALALYDAERPNIEAAFRWLVAKSESNNTDAAKMLVKLVESSTHIRDIRQHPIERIVWSSVAMDAAVIIPDGILALSFLGNIGRARADLGEFGNALKIFEHSLDSARKFDLKGHECISLLQIGNMERVLGFKKEAIENYKQALALAVNLENKSWEAYALTNMGGVYGEIGEYDLSADYLHQGADVFVALGDQLNLGKTLASMSKLSLQMADFEGAITMGQHSFDLVSAIGEPIALIQSSLTLGQALIMNGNHSDGFQKLEAALEQTEVYGLERFRLLGLKTLASCFQHVGDSVNADLSIERHQELAKSMNDEESIHDGQIERAKILELRGEYRESIEIFLEESNDAVTCEDYLVAMKCQSHLADLFEKINDQERSLDALRQAYDLADRISHPFATKLREAYVRRAGSTSE